MNAKLVAEAVKAVRNPKLAAAFEAKRDGRPLPKVSSREREIIERIWDSKDTAFALAVANELSAALDRAFMKAERRTPTERESRLNEERMLRHRRAILRSAGRMDASLHSVVWAFGRKMLMPVSKAGAHRIAVRIADGN